MSGRQMQLLSLAILLFAFLVLIALPITSVLFLVDETLQQNHLKNDAVALIIPEKETPIVSTQVLPREASTTTSPQEPSQQSQPPQQPRCLISSQGSDGLGHQLEAKLSCIATAAVLHHELEYVHTPIVSAEHGTDGTTFEQFVGIEKSLTSTHYAVEVLHLNNDTKEQKFRLQVRDPLPRVGKCRDPSWFQPEIRQEQCRNAAYSNTIFMADNCWDFFYCTLKQHKNVTLIEEAFGRLRAGYIRQKLDSDNNTSSVSELSSLKVVVHIRRTDSGRRKISSAYYSNLIRELVSASGTNGTGRLSIVVHTDQEGTSRRNLLPELEGSYNITIQDKNSVTMQTVFHEMVQADIFITSRSSLSNAAALMGRPNRPVLYPFDKKRVGLSSLRGWTLLRQSGMDATERFRRLEYMWESVNITFFAQILADARKSKDEELLSTA